MKTAVSIPDDIFAEAERLAAERDMTRSALYAEALRALLKRAKDDAVTAAINASLADAPNDDGEQFARRAAAQRAARAIKDGDVW